MRHILNLSASPIAIAPGLVVEPAATLEIDDDVPVAHANQQHGAIAWPSALAGDGDLIRAFVGEYRRGDSSAASLEARAAQAAADQKGAER